MVKPFVVALTLALVAGCIDTGAEPVAIPLSLAGTAAGAPVPARGGVPVTLERADLAFGPLTLCAGFQAGDGCDSALAEWTDGAVIDVLDPTPMGVGELTGISGSARSYMYDLAYVSLLTTTDPLPLPAADSLGGASYVLEGTAEVDGVALPFAASAVLAQDASVERGIPIVRSGASDEFALELDSATAPLTLRFDASAWVADIDFSTLVQTESCAVGVDRVCDGQRALRCGAAGAVLEETDCAAAGQVCQPNVGCVDRIELAAGSQALSAIRAALLSRARPSFE